MASYETHYDGIDLTVYRAMPGHLKNLLMATVSLRVFLTQKHTQGKLINIQKNPFRLTKT